MLSEVNHPRHYGGEENPYEVIKVIEAWKLNFNLGNAVKYLARSGKKMGESPVTALEKAIFYIDREIQRLMPSENRSNAHGTNKE